MRIKLWCVDQVTGERFPEDDCDLDSLFYLADENQRSEHDDAQAAIQRDGQAWIGGGAAPLFLAVPL